MSDPIGAILAGKYHVKRKIGAGGMGAVYEGVHAEIGKRVAIKVIDPAHAGSGEVAARFKREARAASAVESEGIVQVFDVGSDPVVGLYMVMEFLTGEDLSERLAREGKLAPDVAVDLCLQAARALGKAHAAGVVHRDLKPANLFLCDRHDGSVSVKVLDFGISKLGRPDTGADGATEAASGPVTALTRTGVVMGTPQYMSPEQAQGLPLDAATDVWSLGAVLYEALSGRSAFPMLSTYEQMIIRIVTGKPTPLREIAPDLPAQIVAAVEAAMVHDVAARIPDCAALARRLSEARSGEPSAQVVIQRDASSGEASAPTVRQGVTPAPTMSGVSLEERRRTHRASWVIGGIAVGALAIGGGAIWRSSGPPPQAQGVVATASPSPSTPDPAFPGGATTVLPTASTGPVVEPATGDASPLSSVSPSSSGGSASASASSGKVPPVAGGASGRSASSARPLPAGDGKGPAKGQYGAAGVTESY